MEEVLKIPVVQAARYSANVGLNLERFLSEEKDFLPQSKLRQGVAIKARHSLWEKCGDNVQVM